MSDSDTQNPAGQPDAGQPEVAGVNPGLQARFDELTAKRYEAEARAKAVAEQAQLNQERMLAELNALRASQVQSQPSADPYADLDPNLAKALQHVTAQFGTRIETLQRQLQAQTQAAEIQTVAAQQGVQDEAVKARATALIQGWAQKGLQLSSYDAMIFAAGEAALAAAKQAPRDPLGRFQGAQFSGQSPQVATQQQGPKPLPANFANLPPKQQEKLLAERGVDDVPF